MKQRIPVLTSTDPESFSSGILEGGTSAQNVIYNVYPDGRAYATQRPAVRVLSDASETVVDAAGRGVYFWERTEGLYFVNNGTLYRDNYDNVVGSMSSGKLRVTFLELSDKLVILDYENNEGYVLDDLQTLTRITSPGFPANLAAGGAVLDGTLYVLTPQGTIHGCELNDPTDWNALNVLTAEREPDGGVFLTKMLDHIVVLGSKTVEFLYNAANPTGSPLARREDISYRMGAVSGEAVHNAGDIVYFLGTDVSGSLKIFLLANFKLEQVSTPTISSYLTNSLLQESKQFIMSGSFVEGHSLLFVTEMAESGGSYSPGTSLMYDLTTEQWSVIKTTVAGHTSFPVVQWTDRVQTSVRFGTGIMYNGDLVRWRHDGSSRDLNKVDAYFEDGYVASDYVVAPAAPTYADLEMLIVTPEFDNGHLNNKFLRKMALVGGVITGGDDTELVGIRSTDDHYNTWSNQRKFSLRSPNRKLTRFGDFRRRAWELQYTGHSRIRIEALEVDFAESLYA